MFTKAVSSRDVAREPAGMPLRRVLVNMSISCTVSDRRQNIYVVRLSLEVRHRYELVIGRGRVSANDNSSRLGHLEGSTRRFGCTSNDSINDPNT